MCAVSAITDYYREKWPLRLEDYNLPYLPPSMAHIETKIKVSAKEWAEYQELKRRMEEYDRLTGQPDCVKPEVADWEAKVKQIIDSQNT